MNLSRYFEENFFIIPIRRNDKRPIYKQWTDYQLSLQEARQYLKDGYNLAVVSGQQSIKDGYQLAIIDIDHRLDGDAIEAYRMYGTWIQFTPGKGYHIFLRVRPHENVTKVTDYMKRWGLTPHRTTLNPHHEDNTFNGVSDKEHASYFADTVRGTSMYALIAPSQVDGKSYWWLDNQKGEILKL